jgi:hypothetical protein
LVVSQQVITRYGITGKLLGTGDPLSKLCGCAHMGIETIRKALSWLYQWIRGEVSWNQMGILQEDFVEEASLEEVVGEISDNNPLFALFGMVWSWMPFSSDEFSHKGKEYSQKFVHFVKGLQGIKTAFDLLPQIIEWAMCHILAWWQGCTYEDMVLARTFGEKYKQTLSSAQKIIARFEEDNLVASPAMSMEIQRLWEECTAMNTDLKTKVNAPVQRTLAFITKQIGTLKDMAGCHRSTSRQKPEPVSIWLIGPPKKGKSHLYKDLMRDVFALLNFPHFCDIDVFARNPSDDYWENYCGQRVCLFDDWGSVRSEERWEEMIGDMIKVINCAPCPLPMAALEKKANTFFSSPFCIYTSNKGFTNDVAKKAAEPYAVLRRRHFVIHVDLHPSDEVSSTIPKVDKNRWILNMRNPMQIDSEASQGTNISYEKLVYLIACKYMEHYVGFMSNERRLMENVDVEQLKQSAPANLVTYFEALKSTIGTLEHSNIEPVTPETIQQEHSTGELPYDFSSIEEDTTGLEDNIFINDLEDYPESDMTTYWSSVSTYFSMFTTQTQNTVKSFISLISCLNKEDMDRTLANLCGWMNSKKIHIRTLIGVATMHVLALRNNLDIHCSNIVRVDFPTLRERLNQLTTYWTKFVSKNFNYVIAGIFTAVAVAGYVWKQRNTKSEESTLPRNRPDYDKRQAKKSMSSRKGGIHVTMPAFKKGPKGKGGKFTSQSGDQQMSHILMGANSVVQNNMAIIWCAHIRNQMVFIGGRCALTTRHTLESMIPFSKDHMVSVLGCGNKRQKLIWTGSLDKLQVRYHDTKDIAMIEFPVQVSEFPSILKYFPKERDQIKDGPAWLIGICSTVMDLDYNKSLEQVFAPQFIDLRNVSRRSQRDYYVTRIVDGTSQKVRFNPGVCLEYAKTTQKGDCGKLVIQPIPGGSQMLIVGIHQAASEIKSIASMILQEDIQGFKIGKIPTSVEAVLETEAINFSSAINHTNYDEYQKKFVDPLVILDGRYAARYPTKSNLIKTSLFEYVTTKHPSLLNYVPAILHTKDGVNPMQMQVDKQFTSYCNFLPYAVVQRASDSLLDHLTSLPTAKYIKHGKLSLHKAVNGDTDIGLNGLAMNTSEGYPFIWKRPQHCSGKRWLVDSVIEDNITFYRLREPVRDRIRMLEKELDNGEIPIVFVNDLLKDELRPVEKVLQKKTRMFMCSDFAWNIIIRKYFGGFLGFIYNNCIDLEIAIGINPHGQQWTSLYHRIFSQGDEGNYFAGDFGNYDKSLPYQLIIEAATIINKWYNDDYSDIRMRIIQATYNTYHINGNVIYRTFQGNPSGTPLTTLMNSMVNCLLMRLAFHTIMDYFGNDATFNDEVQFSCFGDDNMGSVTDRASEFCMTNISMALETFGMEYTHPNKTTDITDVYFLKRQEITYLKRSFEFNWEGSEYVSAPLEFDSILRPLCWRDSKSEVNEVRYLSDICSDALREMVHYPKEKYVEVEKFLQQMVIDNPHIEIILKRFDRNQLFLEMIGSDVLIRGGSAFSTPMIVESESGTSDHQNHASTPHNFFKLAKPHCLDSALRNENLISAAEQNVKLQEVSGEDQVAMDQVTLKQNIVHFEDKATVDSEVLVPCEKVPDISFGATETLEQVLQRPIRVGTFSWTPDMVEGQYIYVLDFPSAIIEQSAFIKDKLREFSYLRCDIEISIRVNGTAFHYGKLLFAWDPCMRFMDLDYRHSVNNVYSASGNPCVLVSPTQSETMVFTVPFVFPYYYLLLNSYGMNRIANTSAYRSMGGLKVYVLNPLQQYSTAPSNPVGVSIYARMVNVSLQGPANLHEFEVTPLKPVPSTMLTPESTTGSSNYINKATASGKGFVRQAKRNVEAKKKSANPIIEEQEQDDPSTSIATIPVTGTFTRVKNVMKRLYSTLVDTSYPETIAHECNPVSLDPYTAMVPRQFNMANTHGLNPSITLTMHPGATIDKHPCLLGSHAAEMDLDYVFSTPSLARIIPWTAESQSGVQITDWIAVRPGFRGPGYDTILSWSTLPYQMWRGSIRVMFHITASSFHAGRLALVWVPPESGYPQDGATLLSTLEGKAIMRIIDIKTESQVAVTFPYFSMRPWKLRTALNDNARLNAPPNIGDGTVFDLYASGYFAFFVVNELTHSENPPPPVYINAFVSGGEDFQVAYPSIEKLDAGAFQFVRSTDVDETMEPESFTRDEMRLGDYTPMFDYSTIPDNKITAPEVPTTINEVVSRYYIKSFNATSDVILFNRFSSIFAPWTDGSIPFYLWYEAIYRFRRADFNFKIGDTQTDFAMCAATQITAPMIDAGLEPIFIQDALGPASYESLLSQGGITVERPVSNGLEITLPYFGTSLCEITGFADMTDIRREQGLNVNSTLAAYKTNAGDASSTMYVSAGDNYRLGFLVGPPQRAP